MRWEMRFKAVIDDEYAPPDLLYLHKAKVLPL